MSRKYKFLQPTYINKFKCSGGDCSLNCCDYNWNISIDKETYKKYKKVNNKELSEKLRKNISKDSTGTNDLSFAKIKMNTVKASLDYKKIDKDKDKEEVNSSPICIIKCPFQTEDRLCSIQKDLGFDYLSNTCKVFPRVYRKINKEYEKGLNTGCEEVSKLLYQEKNGLQFEIFESDTTVQKFIEHSFKNEKDLILFDNVRATCIGILQLPEYTIENKMILLSVFMCKISDMQEEKKYEEAFNFIENFSNNINIYEEFFKLDRIRNDVFLDIFISNLLGDSEVTGEFNVIKDLQILSQRMKNCYTKENQIKLLSFKSEDGEKYVFDDIPIIKMNPLKTLEDGSITSSKYLKYKKNSEKLIKDKQYYIENILVNSFFSNSYPINGGSIKDNCAKFVISYCFYKGFLTGFLAEEKTLNEDLLHRISTIWGRLIGDQTPKLDNIIKEINKSDFKLNKLSNLILLIKSC